MAAICGYPLYSLVAVAAVAMCCKEFPLVTLAAQPHTRPAPWAVPLLSTAEKKLLIHYIGMVYIRGFARTYFLCMVLYEIIF